MSPEKKHFVKNELSTKCKSISHFKSCRIKLLMLPDAAAVWCKLIHRENKLNWKFSISTYTNHTCLFFFFAAVAVVVIVLRRYSAATGIRFQLWSTFKQRVNHWECSYFISITMYQNYCWYLFTESHNSYHITGINK